MIRRRLLQQDRFSCSCGDCVFSEGRLDSLLQEFPGAFTMRAMCKSVDMKAVRSVIAKLLVYVE